MNAKLIPSAGDRRSLRSALTRTYLALIWLAVGVSSVLLTILGMMALRGSLQQNLQVIARSMSYNVTAAVVFQDRPAIYSAIAAMGDASLSEVADVSIADAKGNVLATWHHAGVDSAQRAAMVSGADWLVPPPLTVPILHVNAELGHLTLTAYGASLWKFLQHGLAWLAVAFLLSALCVMYFARKFAGNIVSPLHNMAQITRTICVERAFNKRVPAEPVTELNDLVNDFNQLLSTLNSWEHKNQVEYARLIKQATRDDLTGLVKRGTFDEHLRVMVDEAAVLGKRLGVLFIDVNEFKQINDSFGHAAGDAVLVGVAKKIRAGLREGDLAARIGGDEFAVLLAHIHAANDPAQVVERLRASLKDPLTAPDAGRLEVSISVGVALYPDDADTATGLLHAADTAMYNVKRSRGPGHAPHAGEHAPADY